MDKFINSFARGHKKQKILETKVQKLVKPNGQQMYLDLGQKLFGRNKECASCGMFYVIGDVDDERRHSQNCAKVILETLLNVTFHVLWRRRVMITAFYFRIIIMLYSHNLRFLLSLLFAMNFRLAMDLSSHQRRDIGYFHRILYPRMAKELWYWRWKTSLETHRRV